MIVSGFIFLIINLNLNDFYLIINQLVEVHLNGNVQSYYYHGLISFFNSLYRFLDVVAPKAIPLLFPLLIELLAVKDAVPV